VLVHCIQWLAAAAAAAGLPLMSLYTRPTIAGCYKRCAITVLSVFKTRRIAYCSIVANLPRFNFLLSPVITMFARWRFVGRVIIVIVASVHAISQQGQ